MPSPLLIVLRVHDVSKPAFQLEPDNVSIHERAARRMRQLGGCERSRHETATGMRQRHETHVVEIERMRGHTVGQRSQVRARELTRPENSTRAASIFDGHRLHDTRRRFDNARQNHTNRVPDRNGSSFARRGERRGTGNKFGNPGGAGFDVYGHDV